MLDTSLQPDLWKQQVHPRKQLQSWCPQPIAGSPVKGKAALQSSSWLPRSAASGGWPGAGLSSLCPGSPSRSPPGSGALGTGSPGCQPLARADGQVACAAVTLLQADFLSPGVGNPRSGAGPWNATSDFCGHGAAHQGLKQAGFGRHVHHQTHTRCTCQCWRPRLQNPSAS